MALYEVVPKFFGPILEVVLIGLVQYGKRMYHTDQKQTGNMEGRGGGMRRGRERGREGQACLLCCHRHCDHCYHWQHGEREEKERDGGYWLSSSLLSSSAMVTVMKRCLTLVRGMNHDS